MHTSPGLRYGFELELLYVEQKNNDEYHSVSNKIVNIVNDKHEVQWGWCIDGNGPEFKTRSPVYDLNAFVASLRDLLQELRANGQFTVSERVFMKRTLARIGDAQFGSTYGSPRGIHFHLSDPSWNTRKLTNRAKMQILAMVPQTDIRSRMSYCVPAFAASKYSTIHIITDDHIELRSFNATMNFRGICKMIETANRVAAAMSHFSGGATMHT